MKHGHSGKTRSREYNIWMGMKARCHNPNDPAFYLYGGRGIVVCSRWRFSFERFLADMGRVEENMSIDRYPDKNGNYEPGNCRWATTIEQANNTRRNVSIEWNGKTQNLSQWADDLGIPRMRLWNRIRKRGWSFAEAIMPDSERCHRTSRFFGVAWVARERRWTMTLRLATGKTIRKYFRQEEDAAMAYNLAAVLEYGPVAKRLNKA